MIEGVVNAFYEPVVPLTLHGPAGQPLEVEAVIDAGYNGLLALGTRGSWQLPPAVRGCGVGVALTAI